MRIDILVPFGIFLSIIVIYGRIFLMLFAPEYFTWVHIWSILLGVNMLGVFVVAAWFEIRHGKGGSDA